MITSQTLLFPNNIEIERVKIPPNFEFKNHSHCNSHICIIGGGSFEEVKGKKTFECKKQSIRISKPAANHEIYFGSEGAECIIIQLNKRFANLGCFGFRFKEDSFFSSDSQNINDFFNTQNINNTSPSGLEILLKKFLVISLNENELYEPDWLKEAKDIVDSNPSYSFDSSKIAEKVGVHRVHLSRSFSKYTGCTLHEYIILRKLHEAHKFLKEPDLNISAAAYEAGFSDQSHFNKIFKKYFNTNPKIYKSKLLSGTHVTNVQENFSPAV